MHSSVEQVRILKVGLIARFLVRNRLQTSREWFVPLRRERSDVSENTFHLIEADLAGERDRIQAGATNGRVSKQGVDVVGGLSPALSPEDLSSITGTIKPGISRFALTGTALTAAVMMRAAVRVPLDPNLAPV